MTSGGLVAVGDSIINGHCDSMAGVPGLSWAQWLADAMDLSYTRYAKGGAESGYIVDELLPRVRGRFTVGAFNMGTNDALDKELWDPVAFRANAEKAAAVLTSACDRVLVLTVPTSDAATVIIREVADQHGVLVVDASLSGGRLLSPDRVHPTALGHLVIADRAADALDAPRPSALAVKEGRGRLGVGCWVRYAVNSIKPAVKRALL